MALVTLSNEDLKQLKKFEITCNTCGSKNCAIEIDWAAYPSASWNTTTVICKDCHEDETCYES
jgi:hypothetical protein